MELWERYTLVIKRGNGSILDCPLDMYEALKADMLAEAEFSRREKDSKANKEFLKARGLIK